MTRFKFRLGRVGDQHIHLQLGDEPSDNDLSIGYATAPWAKLLVDQAMEPKASLDLWQHTSQVLVAGSSQHRRYLAEKARAQHLEEVYLAATKLIGYWLSEYDGGPVTEELARLFEKLEAANDNVVYAETAVIGEDLAMFDQDTQPEPGNS